MTLTRTRGGVREAPMVAPAPIVAEHAVVCRDLVDHQFRLRQVQHDLTGLLVLPHQSLANLARCLLESADNTQRSRFLAAAPWRDDAVNRRRRRASRVVLDDTLCAHGGTRVDYVDRHDHHGAGTDPLAHHPGTSFSGSGPVRFPLGLRRDRRDEELTPGAASVATHCLDRTIPTDTTGRNRLPQQVASILLQAPELRARPEPCRTKMALAMALVDEAIRCQVPVGVVVFDAVPLHLTVVSGEWLERKRVPWASFPT
jgi:hypothetical protein